MTSDTVYESLCV